MEAFGVGDAVAVATSVSHVLARLIPLQIPVTRRTMRSRESQYFFLCGIYVSDGVSSSVSA